MPRSSSDSIDFVDEDNRWLCFFSSIKRSLTRDAPTPTSISINSDPAIEKKATFASPAVALAKSVLPVAG